MALLKAFVCQIVLLGLYKLFLEQVIEDHLVPDELTRNCLVGFVCLLCFGIQLYTDKAGDDIAEAEEDPTGKSKSRESTGVKKFESAEISVTHEAVNSNASSHVMITKMQTTATVKNQSSCQQIIDAKEGSGGISSTEAEKVTKISHFGIFAEFSSNVPDKFGGAAVSEQTSYKQETENIPVLNGISEVNAFEESDEEGIEIDQFVSKESSKEAEQSMTVEVEDEPIKSEHAAEAVAESEFSTSKRVNISSKQDLDSDPMIDESEPQITNENVTEAMAESECLSSNGVNISTKQDLDSEPQITNEDEPIKPEHVTEVAAESESLLSNGVNISSKQNMDSDPIIDESEPQITNGTVVESLRNVDEILSNMIGELESKNLIKDGNEIGDGGEMTSKDASKLDECKDLTKSLPPASEKGCPSTVSTKAVSEIETVNKNSVETSTIVNTKVMSPRRKITAAEGVYATHISIDISFIYACH